MSRGRCSGMLRPQTGLVWPALHGVHSEGTV